MGVAMSTDHRIQADEPQALFTGDFDVSQVETSRSGDNRNKLQTSKVHPDEACLANSVTDSGYGSPPATPDTKINKSDDPEARLQEYPSPLRRRLFRPKTMIRAYQIPVPDHVRNRFKDLKLLFDKPLYDHLCKSGARQLPVVITLQYLGEDESSATPWIVVLCDQSVIKSVKKWFRLSSTRSYYCPDDSDLPRFRVLVHDQAPRLLGANVFADNAIESFIDDQTLCGTLIRFCTESQPCHFATLGGLIKASWQDKFAIYGVTIDPVLHTTHNELRKLDWSDPNRDVELPQADFGNPDAGLSGESQESDASDNDDYELDMSDSKYALSDDKTYVQGSGSEASTFTYGIGSTFTPRHRRKTKVLDWSLIDLDDVKLYRLNVILTNLREPISFQMPTSLGCHTGLSKSVCMISGVSGLEFAIVSNFPAYLHLGGSAKFIEAYSLRLPRGAELKQGDCGSWIVDVHSGEVYGQIVASDVFENAYAVPLGDILEDVKRSLDCDNITFPVIDDLRRCMKNPRSSDLSSDGSFLGPYGYFDNRHVSHLSNAQVIPDPMEGACERCHKHFLRCTRDHSGSHCIGCVKAGCPCVSIPVTSPPNRTKPGTRGDQHPKIAADGQSSLAKGSGSPPYPTRISLINSPVSESFADASMREPSHVVQDISARYITDIDLDKFLGSNTASFGNGWSRKTRDGMHRVAVKRKLTQREIRKLQKESMQHDSGFSSW